MEQSKSDAARRTWLREAAAATDVNDLDFYGLQGDRYACMSNNKVVISCSIIPSSIRPVLNGDIALLVELSRFI